MFRIKHHFIKLGWGYEATLWRRFSTQRRV